MKKAGRSGLALAPSRLVLSLPTGFVPYITGAAVPSRIRLEPGAVMAPGAVGAAGTAAGRIWVRVRLRLERTADWSRALTRPSRLKSNRPVIAELLLTARFTAD